MPLQMAPVGAGADFGVIDPLKIAVMTAKYWGPSPRQLTVSFMETTLQATCEQGSSAT